MRTPAGKECKYYYEDFHRGRSKQECRLLNASGEGSKWHPDDCSNCPVPEILLANACEHMELSARIVPGFIWIPRKVEVTAYCNEHDLDVQDPYVGCQHCGGRGAEILRAIQEGDL
ncbi:MAG: hypothetical protein GYB68_08440 [Chloroflexi bacterium]|nr:hypothetical protein [Chloroflexota bacterium]